MKNNCCQSCKWADIAKDTRVVHTPAGSFVLQSKGGIQCTKPSIGCITITDGEMKCSGYEQEENKNG